MLVLSRSKRRFFCCVGSYTASNSAPKKFTTVLHSTRYLHIMHRVSLLGGVCFVLAATGVVFAQTEKSSPDEDCVQFPGIDFNGGDISGALKSKSDDECCDLCRKWPTCIAWTRTRDGRCWIKKKQNKPTTCKKCTASGVMVSRQTSASNDGCVQLPKIDFNGGDIRNVKTKDGAECCALCQKEPKCVAWTHTTKGRCFLKHTRNEPTSCDHCTASGMMPTGKAPTSKKNKMSKKKATPNEECFKLPQTDFNGGDMAKAVVTSSDEECCDLCNKEPKCVAWTRIKDGRCWIKDIRNKATHCKKCTASGMIFSRQAHSRDKLCTRFPEIDFFGGDIGKGIKTASDAECCKLCQDEPTCVGWTRGKKGTCWIKSTLSEATHCDHCSASGMMVSRQVSAVSEDCVMLPGIDFLGGDISKKAIHTDSDQECCDLCQKEPTCIVWTRTKVGKCWLKDVQEPPIMCRKCSASGFIISRQSPKDVKNLRTALKALPVQDNTECQKMIVKTYLLSTA